MVGDGDFGHARQQNGKKAGEKPQRGRFFARRRGGSGQGIRFHKGLEARGAPKFGELSRRCDERYRFLQRASSSTIKASAYRHRVKRLASFRKGGRARR